MNNQVLSEIHWKWYLVRNQFHPIYLVAKLRKYLIKTGGCSDTSMRTHCIHDLVARYWLETVAGLPCNAEIASEIPLS